MKKKSSEEIQQAHQGLFLMLSKYEKEERIAVYKNEYQNEKKALEDDILEYFWPGFYDVVEKMRDPEKEFKYRKLDQKKFPYSGTSFTIALDKAVAGYDSENKKGGSFCTFFAKVYRNQLADEKMVDSDLTKDQLDLCKQINEEMKIDKNRSPEDIIDDLYVKGYTKHKLYKQDGSYTEFTKGVLNYFRVKDAQPLTYINKSGEEVEQPIPDKASEMETEELYWKDMISHGEYRKKLIAAIECLKSQSPDKWERYRTYITRNMMAILKLDDKKLYPSKSADGKRCPAGNSSVYNDMRKIWGAYWNKVCQMKYIRKTIDDKPEDRRTLYGQYFNELIREDLASFDLLAEVLNLPTDTIRKDYGEKLKKKGFCAWMRGIEKELIMYF